MRIRAIEVEGDMLSTSTEIQQHVTPRFDWLRTKAESISNKFFPTTPPGREIKFTHNEEMQYVHCTMYIPSY